MKTQDLGFSNIQGEKYQTSNQENILKNFHKTLCKAHRWKTDIKIVFSCL
jgi:hypothetical protein